MLQPVNFDLQQYTQKINSIAETVNTLIKSKYVKPYLSPPICSWFEHHKYVFESYICSFIVTKIIAKITDRKFDFFTNELYGDFTPFNRRTPSIYFIF